MQIRSKFVVSVISLLGAVACGDDDGGGGGGTGGVSNNKKVGDLSESEAKALCNGLSSKFQKLGEAQTQILCVAQSAALSGGDEDRCEESVDTCKEQIGEDLGIDCDENEGETGVSDECDEVTVGELNDCLDATVKAMDAIKAKVTCSTDVSELGDLMSEYETPAACSKIEAKCPDVADMEEI